jgi:hypothetical protein
MIQFKTGSQVLAGTINTSQKWAIGTNVPTSTLTPLFDINQNSSAVAFVDGTSGAPALRLIAADSAVNSLAMQVYAQQNTITAYRADGTAASPTGVASGQTLLRIGGTAYDGTVWGGAGVVQSQVAIFMNTSEAQTATAHGTEISFFTTPNTTTSRALAVKIQNSGGFSVGTTSDPGLGMIYTNSASFMIRTKTSYSNGAGASAGTISNAPSVGNPTKWIPVDDNGTTRYIPAW